MNGQQTSQSPELPSYITSATPNPLENRAPWYKNTAPAYAGIFLWFVFWTNVTISTPQAPGSLGGILCQGIGIALLGLLIAALLSHYLFYLVPGLFGMKTGLPLYIIGTSTFGTRGGFIMPGFLMGILQFGWLGVNVYASSLLLSSIIPLPPQVIMVIFGVLAGFVGLKGIQYIAKVATYLPLIPLFALIWMLVKTIGGLGSFDPAQFIASHQSLAAAAPSGLGVFGVIAAVVAYVMSFFATAGAAGVDFGLNNRNKKDVKLGGLLGIALAIFVTAGLSILIVAGAYGSGAMANDAIAAGTEQNSFLYDSVSLIPVVLGEGAARWVMFLLAVAAFPAACFSAFIAANSFKTTLSSINPFISVGIGTAASILLAVTETAGKIVPVFTVMGSAFAPILGAMLMDYILSRGKWNGPRAGFNPAGWIAWVPGFFVGILPNLGISVPVSPLLAFIVSSIVYFICVKMGWQSAAIPLPEKLQSDTTS